MPTAVAPHRLAGDDVKWMGGRLGGGIEPAMVDEGWGRADLSASDVLGSRTPFPSLPCGRIDLHQPNSWNRSE